MQFKGQLLLPDESGPGLDVSLDVAEHHLAVESEDGGLGAWPLEAVQVRRVHGDTFSLIVAGETLKFVAEDTVAFAYSGVQAIERLASKPRTQSAFRSLLGRVWNGPDRSDDPPSARDTSSDESEGEDPGRSHEGYTSPQSESEELPAQPATGPGSPDLPDEVSYLEPHRTVPGLESSTPRSGDHVPAIETCRAIRSDGRPCESQILNDAGYCYPHDPRRSFEDSYQVAQEARAQLRRDGAARLNRIYSRLDKAMRQVERGDLDPETAMAMAQLARTMCAILDLDDPPRD